MKNKNRNEFIALYEPIHQQLFGFCRAISGNTVDAEDLIQDSILSVLKSFDNIKDKSAFKSYIFSVASNLHKMRHRRQKFKARFNTEEINQIADVAQNPEHLTDFKIIYETILSLPQKVAETIILFHISDLSLEDIQKIQGGSISGVKQRLKRGREKILSLLNTTKHVKMALMLLTF